MSFQLSATVQRDVVTALHAIVCHNHDPRHIVNASRVLVSAASIKPAPAARGARHLHLHRGTAAEGQAETVQQLEARLLALQSPEVRRRRIEAIFQRLRDHDRAKWLSHGDGDSI